MAGHVFVTRQQTCFCLNMYELEIFIRAGPVRSNTRLEQLLNTSACGAELVPCHVIRCRVEHVWGKAGQLCKWPDGELC